MAITVVVDASAGSGDNNTATTAGINTTGANTIVVVVSDHPSASAGTVTDSQSNTWTPLTTSTSAASRCQMFYADNVTTHASHTFTFTGGGSAFPSIYVLVLAGTHDTAYTSQQSGATAAAQTVQPGSLTPSEDNCILITGLAFNDGTFTINGGFTIAEQLAFSGGNYFGGAIAYLIQTSAAAANPTWDMGASSADLATRMAVFKSGGGGDPEVFPFITVVDAKWA